jgi:hypothetical protein
MAKLVLALALAAPLFFHKLEKGSTRERLGIQTLKRLILDGFDDQAAILSKSHLSYMFPGKLPVPSRAHVDCLCFGRDCAIREIFL